jgi:GTPase Era involved in 16S rRNA processing
MSFGNRHQQSRPILTGEIAKRREQWKTAAKPFAIVPVSAQKAPLNTEALLELIKDSMPESPAYYDKEDLSDLNETLLYSGDHSRKDLQFIIRRKFHIQPRWLLMPMTIKGTSFILMLPSMRKEIHKRQF